MEKCCCGLQTLPIKPHGWDQVIFKLYSKIPKGFVVLLWKWAFPVIRENLIRPLYIYWIQRQYNGKFPNHLLQKQSISPLFLNQFYINQMSYKTEYTVYKYIWYITEFMATHLFILWISKFCIKGNFLKL